MAKAPSKTINGETVLLRTIVSLFTEINKLSSEVNTKKKEFDGYNDTLSEVSLECFNKDLGALGEEIPPEIYGNHEYPIDDHLISVNMKMKAGGLAFRKVGGLPANEVLKELAGEENYASLFQETKVLMETEEKLEEVYGYRPDLFDIRIKSGIEPEILQKMRAEHPECFSISVKDTEEYVTAIKSALYETEVSTCTGFIEKVSSLPEDIIYKLRDFIRKVLGSCVTTAVKCGNRAA